jgi:formylglycine-generating enzyme required for sulfatase activity
MKWIIAFAVLLTIIVMISFIKFDSNRLHKIAQERQEKKPVKIPMVDIPSGIFLMGSKDGIDEEPAHPVKISAFRMSTTEITEEQYYGCRGTEYHQATAFKASRYRDPRSALQAFPIVNISWYDAVKFCNRQSKKDGLQSCYNDSTFECDFSRNGYRLPTESEWEYACRAGSTTRFNSGDEESSLENTAWYSNNSGNMIHVAGQKKPNAWELYDMLGNAWEWCNDWYGPYSGYETTDPPGVSKGSGRVLRGGACNHPAFDCRVSARTFGNPKYGGMFIGFRIVKRQNN